MNILHPWEVSEEEATQIQNDLRPHLILKNTFSRLKTIGGADVAYSKDGKNLFGAVTVLSYPEMNPIDASTASGEISFPYIPGLFSFREGPILVKAFQGLRVKPDLMIFEGHGIAHPRGLGLASHLGLWLGIPSIGCARTSLLGEYQSPEISKGSYEWVYLGKKKVGAALRTRQGVKPVFVSPGHRIDLVNSVRIVLATCQRYRTPEPLRKAHYLTIKMINKNN
ncbi:MAG: endonuclease V [Deltaproteobacteria bacterium]|nr:endonuclease V [Deltaproteobacteria bacterium]MBM4323947.1 endonuclease V [Deltaproteobacteria bacterium]